MMNPEGRRVCGPVAPLDVGCGTLLPLRWSDLCVVYHYDHNFVSSPNLIEDKPFEMHVLVATTRGRWDFYGKQGTEEVDDTIAVVGLHRDHYGCRHDRRFGDSNLIASLRPFALDDEDEPLFERQVVPVRAAAALRLALRAQGDDDFDSRVFEVFYVISTLSLRDVRRVQAGRLRMQRVKRFIEDHAFGDLALRDIAASIGMSPFACLRQFKVHTGMTPHAYVSAVRLTRAQQLLRKTTLAVGEIGVRIGISDSAYFSRWFAKGTGLTPSRFRAVG
jgi:AraC-like DNA-binding protein